ncbi:MAG: NAD-dependent epimerase/dehydratase family protein [Armatimonadetes bacterium]|nr:NAD-dependent epimerase/dehydratase family protein [Armatimonadota bacterium]
MSNVLLIGGSGFLSGTLAHLAVEHGLTVYALTRGLRPLPAGVRGIIADRTDPDGIVEAVDIAQRAARAGSGWDLVVDCIGYEPQDARQDLEVFRDRAAQFVFVSTDFVYDPAHRAFPQPEESEHYLTTGYGGKKRACELEFINGDAGAMRWTIVRPCHIYGPGSLLGCLPTHGRDPELLNRLRAGDALKLVGAGTYLQQPIYAPDLAALILSLMGNEQVDRKVFCTAGPEVVESREYYRLIAETLGARLRIEEVPLEAYRAAHPEHASFLCHRIYRQDRLRAAGLAVPSTPLAVGLQAHVNSLLSR